MKNHLYDRLLSYPQGSSISKVIPYLLHPPGLFSGLYLEKRRPVCGKLLQKIRIILRPHFYGDSGEFYVCSLHHFSHARKSRYMSF